MSCPQEPLDFEAMGKRAAQDARAAAGDGKRAPAYPALERWLAMAAELRERGQLERLDWDEHAKFVCGYQRELDVLAMSTVQRSRKGSSHG